MTKDSVPRRKHASRRPIALGAAIVAVAGAIAVPVVAQAAEDTPRADTALQSNFAAAAAEYESCWALRSRAGTASARWVPP
ncbi:hypothetical protein PV350_03910 [Streptomyces sp. PA03-6a]|nr:hypothetical protein [Streptomyces sp. PA03-6a]